MSELSEQIKKSLENTDYIQGAYPAITEWGVEDEDVFVHSLGCSVWNTLGHELGFMSVVEAPAPFAAGDDIRSDSVWFDKFKREPKVLIEFERYDGTERSKAKLVEKMNNLMEASYRWGNIPELLILSAWNKGVVSSPDISELLDRMTKGIKTKKGVNIRSLEKCQFMFNRFVFESGQDDLLRLERMMFWESP